MFTLIRITTTPASPLRVQVAQPQDSDAGLTVGGSFYFMPAGDPNGDDRAGMTEHAARTIMGDPGLAPHFRCEPALPAPADSPAPAPSTPPPPAPPAAQDLGIAIREGGRARR